MESPPLSLHAPMGEADEEEEEEELRLPHSHSHSRPIVVGRRAPAMTTTMMGASASASPFSSLDSSPCTSLLSHPLDPNSTSTHTHTHTHTHTNTHTGTGSGSACSSRTLSPCSPPPLGRLLLPPETCGTVPLPQRIRDCMPRPRSEPGLAELDIPERLQREEERKRELKLKSRRSRSSAVSPKSGAGVTVRPRKGSLRIVCPTTTSSSTSVSTSDPVVSPSSVEEPKVRRRRQSFHGTSDT